ncbi:MAG: hypothetical protein ACI9KA_001263, partial [Parasphingorhabdus sp.]|uniref:hypothetical protein n=1 Tax=Parasphingorhabdus sp. TaxID=2709688 RepID=UPI0039E5C77B
NHEGSDNMAPQPFADLEDNHLVIGMETKRMASLWENQLDNSALFPVSVRKFVHRQRNSTQIFSYL